VFLEGSGVLSGGAIFRVDESGKSEHVQTASGLLSPRVSPDGKRLAYSAATPAGADLWVRDLSGEKATRLSFLPGASVWPVWLPDGKTLVFMNSMSRTDGKLYWIRSDGSGGAQF
jgi:Tol biopolymer transport system component